MTRRIPDDGAVAALSMARPRAYTHIFFIFKKSWAGARELYISGFPACARAYTHTLQVTYRHLKKGALQIFWVRA